MESEFDIAKRIEESRTRGRVLDYSSEEITITLTSNERKLIYELLQTIQVDFRSLSYSCAKSLMEKMAKALEKNDKQK